MSILSNENEIMDDIPYKTYRIDERLIDLEEKIINCSAKTKELELNMDKKIDIQEFNHFKHQLEILQTQIQDLMNTVYGQHRIHT